MSYFDAVVYSKLAKSITQEQLDAALAEKYDKTGGAITGDVAITGNLTVSGTITTEKEKQLLVEDNVIATNANKVDLQTLLSGLAINKNANATYGIMYDPTDDTVKFGEGTLDENNKFVFKDGEGHPLAIRADSSQFTDGYLVKWDEATMSFVQANLKEDNVSKKISGITFSKNAASVTFDMDKGMSLVNMGELTYADQSTGAIATGIEIPIIPGNGMIMDATEVANHVTVKVDPEHSVYMANAPEAENAIPVYAKSSKTWIGLAATPSATASSVVTRDASGRMQAGTPANDGDVAIKSYVDTAVSDSIAISSIEGTDPVTASVDENKKATIGVSELVARLDKLPTTGGWITPTYNVGTKSWHGELAYSGTAVASTYVVRDSNGVIVTGTPIADNNATTKKYVDDAVAGKQAALTAGTGISIENDTIAVTKNVANIATLPELPTDVIPYYSGDLATWSNKELAVGSRANTIALRTTRGTLTVADPTIETDAATKKYVDDNVAITSISGTSPIVVAAVNKAATVAVSDTVPRFTSLPAQDDKQHVPVYDTATDTWTDASIIDDAATADTIVKRGANGVIVTGTPTAESHAATKAYVDAAIIEEGPASTIVNLSAPDEATQGILTEDELAKLQASDNASIMFSHKKYDLGGKGHQEGYLTYTHAGYENNVHILESITITISTRAWVLNATDVLDEEEIKAAIQPMIPSIPTWKTTAPTTDADKAKVQFTKVIITTADETHFPGMNERYAIVPGFTDDGFNYGTVVCMHADPAYEFPFIGSITSTMASGLVIKASVAPAYVSVVDPEVTFAYEYLW